MMRIVDFTQDRAQPISLFDSKLAASVALADGSGETHVYCVYIEAGGCIGAHPTGFGQLFLVMQGSGWAAGADGVRVPLRAGEGAFFERGELHSKGSESGLTALMVQVSQLSFLPCAASEG